MLTLPSTHLVIISYDTASGRIKKFYDSVNPAQVTLIVGNHIGSIEPLVKNYLPKAAIDRIQERFVRNLEKRGITNQKNLADSGDSQDK